MPGLLSWVVKVIRDSEYEASDVVPGPSSNIRRPLAVFPSLHRVLWDQFPGFISTMRRYDFLSPIPPHFVSFAWQYLGCTRCFAPRRTSAPSRPGVGNPVLQPGIAEETTGSPKFLGNPNCPFAHVPIRRRQDCCTRPLRCCSVALDDSKAKAPTIGLSTLNSMAFELVVYASQDRLPCHHARLTSSCWSGSTGRAFHPQGSVERFQSCNLYLILLSQASLGARNLTAVGNGRWQNPLNCPQNWGYCRSKTDSSKARDAPCQLASDSSADATWAFPPTQLSLPL